MMIDAKLTSEQLKAKLDEYPLESYTWTEVYGEWVKTISEKEAEAELRKHPIGTSLYVTVKHALEDKLKESDPEKYTKRVLCFGSHHVAFVEGLEKLPVLQFQHTLQPGIHELPWDVWNSLPDNERPMMPIINEAFPFTMDGHIRAIPRFKAEYDLRYRQLIAVAYITDGEKVVVLQTNDNNRIANRMTFIQGHVEFSSDIYFHTELEYLRLSVLREIEEELIISDKKSLTDAVPELPKFVVNRQENFADMEHYGVVYEVRVDSVDEFLSSVTSGEADKHSVTSISIEDLESHKEQLDDWAYAILEAAFPTEQLVESAE